MKNKLTYDDIKLNGKVRINGMVGEITCIDNFASIFDTISEPIFKVTIKDNGYQYFGLKFILRNYIQ